MRKEEIVVGGTYSNGKEGRRAGVRRVIGAGPQFKLYPSQEDTDCIGYEVIAGPKVSDRCTRTSFAAWAKARVDAQTPA